MNYESFLRAALAWLDLHFCKSGFFHFGLTVLNQYLRMLKHHGASGAIKFSKDFRHRLYLWLAESKYKSFVGKDPSLVGMLPKNLKFLSCVKQEKDFPLIRLVLTALYASRELKLPVKPNVDSITRAPSFDKGVINDMSNYVGDFWKVLGYRPSPRRPDITPKGVRFKGFHMSTKTGPSGHQSTWSAYRDAMIIPDTLVRSICAVGGSKLAKKLNSLRALRHPNPLDSYFADKVQAKPSAKLAEGRFRKVSPIQSQEGKTREVAIMDYWSQTALRGLHKYLFKWLRRIPQDCTFDQGSFVQKLPANGDPFYSIDLTAATDRFPIVLIETVLAGRFPPSFIAAWRDIMVGYPFCLPNGDNICYSVGNPMGAYSSWNSFALSHHFVMFYCSESLGINWSEAPYVILGDDVLIRHERLAKKYLEVINSLGMEVSPSKTHISTSFREFAKRIFIDDCELTPFPISALWTTRSSSSLTLNVVESEVKKGWLATERTPDVLSDLYRFLRLPGRVRRKRTKLLNIAYDLLIGLQGRIDTASVLKPSLVKYYPGIPEGTDMMNVIKSTLMDAFARSAEPRKDGKVLGDVAIELVCMLTDPSFDVYLPPPSVDRTSWTSFDLIASIPCLSVHGQIEEKYMEIRKQVLDCLSVGDWKLVLRALTIPLSDEIFYCRNEEIQPKASFTLAKILSTYLDRIDKGLSPPDSAIDAETILKIKKQFGLKDPDATDQPEMDYFSVLTRADGKYSRDDMFSLNTFLAASELGMDLTVV